MSNPNNSFGTNAGYSGRTSVNAFNDVLGAFTSRGIISGWACSPDSGMDVVLGGDGTSRDVAIAEDNIGNRTSVNNISETPISITIPAAPGSNSRIDAIVAYIGNPPVSDALIQDAYDTVNALVVSGSVSNSPVKPDDTAIRTAITADGASGVNAYYVVLAYVTVASGTTDITSNMIEQGTKVSTSVADGSVTASSISPLGGGYNYLATAPEIDVGDVFTSVTITQTGYYKVSANMWVAPDVVGNIYYKISLTKNASTVPLASSQVKIIENYDQNVMHIDAVLSLSAGDVVRIRNTCSYKISASDISLIASRWIG